METMREYIIGKCSMEYPSYEEIREKGIVCKVQLPLFTSEEVPKALIYSEDRETINVQLPVVDVVIHGAFTAGVKKAFIYCLLREDRGLLFLGPTAEWEDW